jgi:hypothetical protein
MPIIPRDRKLTLTDVALTLTLGGGLLFWLYALLLLEGLAAGSLEVRPVARTPPPAHSRP